MIIPREILDDYKSLKTAAGVTFSLRALTNVDNERGETYVIGDDQAIVVYSGKFGEKKERHRLIFEEILKFSIQSYGPFVLLTLTLKERQMSMKFRGNDEKKLCSIKRLWEKRKIVRADDQIRIPTKPASQLRPQPMDIEVPFSPMIAFSAALHSIIQIDNETAEAEQQLLELLVLDQEIIDEGMRYWQNKGTTELIVELASLLTREQKRCLTINLIDMAMIDGVLRSSEREYLSFIFDLFEISKADSKAMFNMMMLKNGLHVFERTESVAFDV